MFKIENGDIYHTRGDTAEFDVNITDDGVLVTDCEVLFTVKRFLNDKKYLLQKQVIDGHLRLEHSDTQQLPFGNHYYDISVKINDGTAEGYYTSFGPNRYCLLADVTTE